jgi:hypothetical protein
MAEMLRTESADVQGYTYVKRTVNPWGTRVTTVYGTATHPYGSAAPSFAGWKLVSTWHVVGAMIHWGTGQSYGGSNYSISSR